MKHSNYKIQDVKLNINGNLDTRTNKEIAGQLDCGFRCFWNRKSNELIFLPDPLKHPLMEMEVWAEEMEKVDNNFDDFEVIEPPGSRESFEFMIKFTETLADSNKLKGKLINAFNKRNPFGNLSL